MDECGKDLRRGAYPAGRALLIISPDPAIVRLNMTIKNRQSSPKRNPGIMAELDTATDLNTSLMKTALSHFIQHAENVSKGTDEYTFVDDLHFALDRYFEEHAVALQITDTHDLHAALELCGYKIMYSGVSTSVVNDPTRSGLVVHGFGIDMSIYEGDEDDEEEEEEEDSEAEDEEDDEDEEELELEVDDDEVETAEEEFDEEEEDEEEAAAAAAAAAKKSAKKKKSTSSSSKTKHSKKSSRK